jgi:PAS domain S-box-containing protein
MILKRTTRTCSLLLATVGCLNIFGQPASSASAATLSGQGRQIIGRSPAGGFDQTLIVVGVLAVVASLALLWVLLLRRKLAGQTAILQQNETRFRALIEQSLILETLLEHSPDCIYFKDRDSRFVRYSKAYEKLFNISDVKDLKGKTDFDFFLPEHARSAFEDEQEIIRTGTPLVGKFETERHPDGRVTHALTTKVPWRDPAGNIVGTFGISKDITPLKETEARLAYERDLFHALLENFPDAIYFKDLESRFVRVSRSKSVSSMNIVLDRYRSEHPGVTDEQLPTHLQSVEKFGEWLAGKTDFDTFCDERARTAFEDEREIIRSGEPMVAKIERTPQADGRTTWCISTKLPWRDKEGQIIGTFGVSKDITALKQAEAELEAAHQRLLETSRLAGMAEVATDVLHNVGNVLNSVNVSCSLTIDRVKASKIASLAKTAALIEENRGRLGDFFANDPRGQQIPSYLAVLSEHFSGEQSALMQELEQLLKHIEHIKQIVAMQQNYAKVAGVIESVNPTQLVDDAVHINGAALTRHEVQVRCEFEPVPTIQTEKHRVLQILVNLIRNAKYALDESKRRDKILTVKLGRNGGDHVKIQVIDNGVGIPAENLTRIFGHGFTTRSDGHGFGLHSSAIAIKELGGTLTAQSDGVGKGATFTLLLPEKPPIQSEDFP